MAVVGAIAGSFKFVAAGSLAAELDDFFGQNKVGLL